MNDSFKPPFLVEMRPLKKYAKLALVGLATLVCLFIYWVPDRDWQEGENEIGYVNTLALTQSDYGQKVYAVVVFDDESYVKMFVPVDMDLRAGDKVLLSVLYDKNKPSRKQYIILNKVLE